MTKKLPNLITLAIANDAPIGIVCVVMKAGLSRLYLWDTDTDTFTPGQFVKADAAIQSISSDGKYFSYAAHSHYRGPARYVCVARPPYFTALAFFPTSMLSRAGANFADGNRIIVNTDNTSDIAEEISPDCPFVIDRVSELLSAVSYHSTDSRKNRLVFGRGNIVYERRGTDLDENEIHTFEYEDFVGIEPPDWAKTW